MTSSPPALLPCLLKSLPWELSPKSLSWLAQEGMGVGTEVTLVVPVFWVVDGHQGNKNIFITFILFSGSVFGLPWLIQQKHPHVNPLMSIVKSETSLQLSLWASMVVHYFFKSLVHLPFSWTIIHNFLRERNTCDVVVLSDSLIARTALDVLLQS